MRPDNRSAPSIHSDSHASLPKDLKMKSDDTVARSKTPTRVERGRVTVYVDGNNRVSNIERGRLPTCIEGKTELLRVERRRKPTSVHADIRPSNSIEKNAKKRSNLLQHSDKHDLTQIERERHKFQLSASKTSKLSSFKNAKKPVGVTVLSKTGADKTGQLNASNKHVVATLPVPTHTDSTQYDPLINYAHLSAPSKEHVNLPNHTDSIQQYQPSKDNTNLAVPAEDDLPFLTKKSSSFPVVRIAFCDRISITYDMPNQDAEDIIFKARDLAVPTGSHYSLRRWQQTWNKLYDLNYRLVDKNRKQVALFQFGPNNPRTNFARIELNPGEIGPEGIDQVKRILKALVGLNYRDYLAEGSITRLDATVDIDKLRPNDVMICSDRARVSSLWQRGFNRDGHEEWATETLCIGSPTSDYFAVVYDKAAQLWKVKGICLDELRTRIEVRFAPRGKDSRSLCVKDILQIKNPFAPLKVAYYPSPADDDPWFYFFICAIRNIGAEEALRKIKDRNKRALYRQKLLEHEPDWWQPGILWAQFLSYLQATGLFPDEIFQVPKKKDQ